MASSDIEMSSSDIGTSPPSRWLPSIADLVFLVVALVALRGAGHSLLDDPGLGWHLRNIDAIRANGWWLTTDPFTEPGEEGERPYLTNQWLGDLFLGWVGGSAG